MVEGLVVAIGSTIRLKDSDEGLLKLALWVRDMRSPSPSLRSVVLCRARLGDRLYDRQSQGCKSSGDDGILGYGSGNGSYVARKCGPLCLPLFPRILISPSVLF